MNRRIILVEDHDSVRRSLARALTASGFAVRSFECAEQVLELADVETSADCLLVDVHLPGFSGVELCTKLRERGVQAPVVCISSDPSDLLQAAALGAGAVAYLIKPFEIESLLSILESALSRSLRA